jgi:hypothetical protein
VGRSDHCLETPRHTSGVAAVGRKMVAAIIVGVIVVSVIRVPARGPQRHTREDLVQMYFGPSRQNVVDGSARRLSSGQDLECNSSDESFSQVVALEAVQDII